MLSAFAGDEAVTLQAASGAAFATGAARNPNIDTLRDDYAVCLRRFVKRYNDGTREAGLVAEMTTESCTSALNDIRWLLLASGAAEMETAAYAARLKIRARGKLAEMVEYGF